MSNLLDNALLLSACAVIFFTIVSDTGLLQLQKLNNEVEQLDSKILNLRSEILDTSNNIHGIQNDPHTLEKYARESLGLSREDEIVYILPRQ